VHVTDIAGDIDASGSRGDIVLMLRGPGTYSINAKTKLGTIATDFTGDTQRRFYLLGWNFTNGNTPGSHRIRVRMGYGGITVKSLPKEAYAPSAEWAARPKLAFPNNIFPRA